MNDVPAATAAANRTSTTLAPPYQRTWTSREQSHAIGSPAQAPGYRPDIDGLRGISVLAVIAAHLGMLSSGFIGVDVFFVISGYLISGIIVRELLRGTFRLSDFYSRRVVRIFPALLVVLLTCGIVGWTVLPPRSFKEMGDAIWAGAGFLLNFTFDWSSVEYRFFHAWPNLSLSHLWSLGVEEQFYLIWPACLLIVWRYKRGAAAFLASVIPISFCLSLHATAQGEWMGYGVPWARLWQLAAGGALAYVELPARKSGAGQKPASARFGEFVKSHGALCRGLCGIALLGVSFLTLADPGQFPGWRAVIPTLGALLAISAGSQSVVNRCVLAAPTLVFVGRISYPLYLWHLPAITTAYLLSGGEAVGAGVCAVIISAVLSFLTFRYIELPLRFAPDRRMVIRYLSAGMCGCVVVGYLISAGLIPSRPVPRDVERLLLAANEDWIPGSGRNSWTLIPNRILTLGNGRNSTLYIGDGAMAQYFARIARVIAARPSSSHKALFAIREGCAPAAIEVADTSAVDRDACRRFLVNTLDVAKNPAVDRVVLGASWALYFAEPLADGRMRVKDGANRALADLASLIAELHRAAKTVYLVLDNPISDSLDPRLMIRPTIIGSGYRVVVHDATLSDATDRARVISSELRKLAAATGARVVDPVAFLCSDNVYPAVSVEGIPIYHDWAHLRPSYIRSQLYFLDETVLDKDLP